MGDFRCVGPACVATCCAGWRIPVDEDTASRWAEAGPASALAASTRDERGTSMRLVGGRCAALTSDGWCGLQREAGEDALPWGCSSYPRTARSTVDGIQVTAWASCPEIARLLLADDAALGWRDGTLDDVPRRIVERLRPDEEGLAATRVTGLVQAVLASPRWPLRVRLAIAVLALVPLDAPAPATWGAAFERLVSLPPTWADDAAALAGRVAPSVDAALAWVDGVVATRLRADAGALAPVLARVADLPRRGDVVATRGARLGPVLDGAFARHARYLALQVPPGDDGPAAWLREVLLHAAAVRALVLAVDGEPEPETWLALVEEVVWRHARELEHRVRATDPAARWLAPEALRTAGGLLTLTAP